MTVYRVRAEPQSGVPVTNLAADRALHLTFSPKVEFKKLSLGLTGHCEELTENC